MNDNENGFFIGKVKVSALTDDEHTREALEVLRGGRWDQPYWADDRFTIIIKNGLICIQYQESEGHLVLANAIPAYGTYKTMIRRFFEEPRVSIMTALKGMIWLGLNIDDVIPFEARMNAGNMWINISGFESRYNWMRLSPSYERKAELSCVRFKKKERGTMVFDMTDESPTVISAGVLGISNEMQVDYKKEQTAILIPGYDYKIV